MAHPRDARYPREEGAALSRLSRDDWYWIVVAATVVVVAVSLWIRSGPGAYATPAHAAETIALREVGSPRTAQRPASYSPMVVAASQADSPVWP